MTRALLAALAALLMLPTAIAGADPLPTLTIADASVAEGNSGATAVGFVLTLSQASAVPVTVAGDTIDGTAKAGEDYVAESGDVTFAPGETQITVLIDAKGDTTPEADETFDLLLSNPDGATIADDRATATIRDDDPALSARDVETTEGDARAAPATVNVPVELNHAHSLPVSVTYTTVPGTAVSGSDFAATSRTITIPAGSTTQMVGIRITGDSVYEEDETFSLVLSSPSGAALADDRATVTIHDNDPIVPHVSINDVNVGERTGASAIATFVVSLSVPTTREVRVNAGTRFQTADGGDITPGLARLVFAPGETTKTFDVSVLGDPYQEPTESFQVALSGPAGLTIERRVGVGWIHDDDPPRCIVPNVQRVTLAVAKRRLWKAHCTLGRVTRRKVKSVENGRVMSAAPKEGALLRVGAKVNLVVSGRPAKRQARP